jgi:hypothetical protein
MELPLFDIETDAVHRSQITEAFRQVLDFYSVQVDFTPRFGT